MLSVAPDLTGVYNGTIDTFYTDSKDFNSKLNDQHTLGTSHTHKSSTCMTESFCNGFARLPFPTG